MEGLSGSVGREPMVGILNLCLGVCTQVEGTQTPTDSEGNGGRELG